jgi:soluble lytic murein transglycosylase-like protein
MSRPREEQHGELLIVLLVGALLLLAGFLWPSSAQAQETPASAVRYRAELTRIAHAEAGLDAPIALFAAQIHQESGWNPQAVSRVGALGMAQFMPATAQWWCKLQGLSAEACQPANPAWAMRGMIGYDRWLSARVRGDSEYDRWWATLRSYNGGLGHWQAEAALARPAKDRQSIDNACGKGRRHPSHCRENLAYPQRILDHLQRRYLSWGRGVSA